MLFKDYLLATFTIKNKASVPTLPTPTPRSGGSSQNHKATERKRRPQGWKGRSTIGPICS